MNHCTSYQDILKTTLERRIKANPRYSLRALAKDLDIGAPRLSSILSYKQGISEKVAHELVGKLGLKDTEKEIFILSSVASDHRSKQKRREAQGKLDSILRYQQNFNKIDEDEFKLISDWQYYTIMELIKTNTFNDDVSWIARRLGLSKFEAKCSMERLYKLGIIGKNAKGKIVLTKDSFSTKDDVPSEYVKSFQREILDKAKEAVDLQSIHERDFSTLTFGVDTTKIADLKKMIKDFRSELNRYVEAIPENDRNEVYVLSANLFKLTQKVDDAH